LSSFLQTIINLMVFPSPRLRDRLKVFGRVTAQTARTFAELRKLEVSPRNRASSRMIRSACRTKTRFARKFRLYGTFPLLGSKGGPSAFAAPDRDDVRVILMLSFAPEACSNIRAATLAPSPFSRA
jgi:hypothetical protein